MRPAAVTQCSSDFCHSIIALLAVSLTVVSTLPTCRPEGFLQMQTQCQEQNKRFLDAEKPTHSTEVADSDHDSSELCEALFDLWRCVAQHIPQCFSDVSAAYASYSHSPYNCAPSKQLVLELQKLVSQGAGGGAAVTDKSTQEPTSVTPSASTGSQERDDNMDDEKKSNSSSHTGPESSASCCFDLSLIIVSWLMARGMLLLSTLS